MHFYITWYSLKLPMAFGANQKFSIWRAQSYLEQTACIQLMAAIGPYTLSQHGDAWEQTGGGVLSLCYEVGLHWCQVNS